MLDIIAKFFLAFGREEIMVPLSVCGYICHDRNKWGRIIYIILFSMIVASYLKSIWQIPLAGFLKSDGWAFPSGHMFGACAFYLQISREMQKRWISNTAYVLLLGIAFGLIQQKYHNIHDVLGAIGFAIILLFCYNIIIKKNFFQKRPDLLIIIILPIALTLILFIPIIYLHIIAAISGLSCFAIGWMLTYNISTPKRLSIKMISILIFAGIVFIIYKILWSIDILPLYRLVMLSGASLFLINIVLTTGAVIEDARKI